MRSSGFIQWEEEMIDTVGKYFCFDTFTTPAIIAIAYFLGAIALTGGPILYLCGITGLPQTDVYLLSSIAVLTGGNVLFRVICEFLMVIFTINEKLDRGYR